MHDRRAATPYRAHQKPFKAEKPLIKATKAIQSMHEEKVTQAYEGKTGESIITCSLWDFCCYSAVLYGTNFFPYAARLGIREEVRPTKSFLPVRYMVHGVLVGAHQKLRRGRLSNLAACPDPTSGQGLSLS